LGQLTIVPKFAPAVCQTPSTSGELMIAATSPTNSDDALVCNGGVVTQVGAPDICILRFSKITIATSGILKVSGLRAVALVADGEVNIAGLLDVSADLGADGPAGGRTSDGASTGTNGGGGAGFRTLGAGAPALLDKIRRVLEF
jgi:hypothetical protein